MAVGITTPSKRSVKSSPSTVAARVKRRAKTVKRAATNAQSHVFSGPSLFGVSSMPNCGCSRQCRGQLVVAGTERVGRLFLQLDRPGRTTRLLQDRLQEQGRSPLALAEVGHQQGHERLPELWIHINNA